MDLLEHSIKLKKMCHREGCEEPFDCPQQHPKCKPLLDTQTAMAWKMADMLYILCNERRSTIYREEVKAIAEFCWQVLGKHKEEMWFRKDIFKEFDYISAASHRGKL